MKRRIIVTVSLLSIVAVLFVVDVEACSCMKRQACEYASSSDAVFIGKVVETSEVVRRITRRVMPLGGDWEDEVSDERRQISKLVIQERYLGLSDIDEVLIETDNFSSCSFSLKVGETYLVYADRSDTTPNLMTGFCSGTKVASAAAEEIEMLDAERGKLSTVFGKIGFGRFGALDPIRLKDFGVNKIKLIGEGTTVEGAIQADGRFRFGNVPAGQYRLEPIMPDTLLIDGEYNDEIAEELEIEDQRLFSVNGIGCFEKQMPVRENGRISGKLTDVDGAPIGNVTVYAVPLDRSGRPIDQEEPCYDTDLCVSSQDDGSYLIKGLKSGRYLIGVRLDEYVCNDCANSEFKRSYYPGVSTEKRAKPVVVGLGKKLDNIDLRLFEKYPKREISGIVVFGDGRPAPNVNVRLVARTPDRKRNGITFIKTDANGYFRFIGYEEHLYLIGAFTDQRDGNEPVEAKAIIVNVQRGRSIDPLRLVLDQTDTDDDYSEFDTGKPGS